MGFTLQPETVQSGTGWRAVWRMSSRCPNNARVIDFRHAEGQATYSSEKAGSQEKNRQAG